MCFYDPFCIACKDSLPPCGGGGGVCGPHPHMGGLTAAALSSSDNCVFAQKGTTAGILK